VEVITVKIGYNYSVSILIERMLPEQGRLNGLESPDSLAGVGRTAGMIGSATSRNVGDAIIVEIAHGYILHRPGYRIVP